MNNNSVFLVPDSEFIKIVSNSSNIRQALLELGLKAKGGNYKTLKNRCKKLKIEHPKISTTNQKNIRNNLDLNQVKNACKECKSRRSVFRRFGLSEAGSNHRWIKKLIQDENINTDHWLGQAHLKGGTHDWSPKKPIEEYLTKDSNCNTGHLKNRLIKEGCLIDKCSKCSVKNWQGEKLSLHLDHINGDNCDNRLENLRLLCPNCHSLTETYAGKNKGR